MGIADSGERRAWDLLAGADAGQVCVRAGAEPAGGGCFSVASFGWRFRVDPSARLVDAGEAGALAVLARHGDLLRLSLLWCLVKASPARPGGRLVSPARLPGGDLFARGTHVLPLDALAAAYDARPGAFLAAAAALGGRPVDYGDAAAEIPALPKVPVTIILWRGDDEFPPRADLLFDASAPRHLPTDVLWGIASLAIQLLQEQSGQAAP